MQETKLPAISYYLDETDPDILVLRRQDDSVVAAFSAQGATREGIREAAIEDYRALVGEYLRSRGEADLGSKAEVLPEQAAALRRMRHVGSS